MSGDLQTSDLVTVLGLTFAVYMAPSVIAFVRWHHNAAAILVLNIFLGWTFLGWVGASVWAFTSVRRDRGYLSARHRPQQRSDPSFD